MVQAAGRCNREAALELGRVVIFRAPTQPPRGTPRKGLEVTDSMLRDSGSCLNPADPHVIEAYFRMLYFAEDLDSSHIQTLRQEFNFATVAREFRLIEDEFTRPVIVPYAGVEERLDSLRQVGPSRDALRALQRFIVNIYPDTFRKLAEVGALEQVTEGVFALSSAFGKLYDDRYGLVIGDSPAPDPSALIL